MVPGPSVISKNSDQTGTLFGMFVMDFLEERENTLTQEKQSPIKFGMLFIDFLKTGTMGYWPVCLPGVFQKTQASSKKNQCKPAV